MRPAQRITTSLVQEWVEHFTRKNEDYRSEVIPGLPEGFENADVLGVQGQFAEIWRKIWKLYKGMWKGETLTGEPVREVLLDLIGHCFLAIEMMDRNAKSAEPEVPPIGSTAAERWAACGAVCTQGHTYTGSCAMRGKVRDRDA